MYGDSAKNRVSDKIEFYVYKQLERSKTFHQV